MIISLSAQLRHCRHCRTSNSLFQMADIVKAEEILPDSRRSSQMWHAAFKKPGADTPGKRDDLDYDIGNLEATDNHQVNMDVGLIPIGLTCRSSVPIRRHISFVSHATTHSFWSITCSSCQRRTRTLDRLWLLSSHFIVGHTSGSQDTCSSREADSKEGGDEVGALCSDEGNQEA